MTALLKERIRLEGWEAVRALPPIVLLLMLLAPAGARAEGPAAGLVLRLEAGGETDVRVTPAVALFVPKGGSASPFLNAGPFKATFAGALTLEKRSRLVFTLEGTGAARLLVDDKVLLEGLAQPEESQRLSSGAHKIVVEYESPAEGDAQLRLFWEERDFSREPVPAAVFTHEGGDAALAAHTALRTGRALFAEKNCAACHDPGAGPAMPELLLKGPSLDGIGARLAQDWLARWIENPSAVRAGAHMPVLFKEDAGQKAADIAAYLWADAPKIEAGPVATAEQVTRGGRIFYEQGCIACHTIDGANGAERIDLKAVGAKYRPGALAAFLREPAKHHEATRMPNFAFSEEEAKALAGFLRSLQDAPGELAASGDAARGKALFAGAGCLNCHERGGEKSTLPPGPSLADLEAIDCTKAAYRIDAAGEERAALTAFVASKGAPASLARAVPAEFARRQLTSLRCIACHADGAREPLRETYEAEVAHLKPPPPAAAEEKPVLKIGAPPLTRLGLKLRPEWRARLLEGKITPKIRPWLPARMPGFPSRGAMLSDGLSHAMGLPAASPPDVAPDPAAVAIGEAMTGVNGGLACGTCHGIGDKPPIAVFEGEGPNFRDIGARLSHEYFHLWMNDPPRAWPGTIMPKYAIDGKTPLTQHYEGDAVKQFEAIYHYLRAFPTPPEP